MDIWEDICTVTRSVTPHVYFECSSNSRPNLQFLYDFDIRFLLLLYSIRPILKPCGIKTGDFPFCITLMFYLINFNSDRVLQTRYTSQNENFKSPLSAETDSVVPTTTPFDRNPALDFLRTRHLTLPHDPSVPGNVPGPLPPVVTRGTVSGPTIVTDTQTYTKSTLEHQSLTNETNDKTKFNHSSTLIPFIHFRLSIVNCYMDVL